MAEFEGVVNVLKPPGMTSSDAVCDLRHIFNMKRVGHMGTLDPGAAGVLPVALGRATRLFDYLIEKQKHYIAEIAFQAATDTQDAYGTITETDKKTVTKEELVSVLPRFKGEITQEAPIYSALNQNGVKLYKLAREGRHIERKFRNATIYGLSVIKQTSENKFMLDVVCSKGTYIRTLCSDIGKSLSTCAHMSFLLRASTGAFDVDNSFSIDELREMKERGELSAAVTSAEAALDGFTALYMELTERELFHLQNGIPATLLSADVPEGEPLRLYCNGEFLGIGVLKGKSAALTLNFRAGAINEC